MDKFLQWWKRDKRYVTLVKSVLLAALPVVCCLVYCAAQGKTVGQVYLPASEWNDELFYYKQVEGIIHYGYPQGYFGFNESHALKLSFAAWSPVLVFPWVIWGLVFGWNLLSPVLCNIFLMALCCFLFVWLVKPDWKQMGILVFLFCLYYPFVRYMLSGMPEVICFTMVILFYGLAINYQKGEKAYKLALLFIMAGIMALMRPYLILFMLLPMYFWVKRSGARGLAGSVAVLGATGGLYAAIKHYLGAEYFTPLFFTDWITAFFERGILGGLRFTLGKLRNTGVLFLRYGLEGFRSGMAAGAFFDGYLALLAVLAVQSILDYRKIRPLTRLGRAGKGKAAAAAPEDKAEPEMTQDEQKKIRDRLIVEAHLALCYVAMVTAVLLMYKLTEGSKHLLTFMAAGIFIVALMETRFYKKAVFLGAVFVFFYSYKAVSAYDYQVPFATEPLRQQVEEWTGSLEGSMELCRENAPGFENVVIWVTYDNTPDGAAATAWQLLYGLPEGYGISCCEPEFVLQNFDSLKSRYLFCPSGGQIDVRCREAGYAQIRRDKTAVLYRLDEKED